MNNRKKRETYGVESTSRAGGAREAPGVRLRSLALQPTSTQSVAIPWRHQKNNTACAHNLKVRIDTKWRKNRNHRQLRRPIVSLMAPQGLSQSGCTAGQQSTSLAPQALKKSQSSAGFIKIVESAAGIIVDIVGSAGPQ